MGSLRIFLVLAATAFGSGSGWTQDSAKDALVNDPAVRESLGPGVTPLGRAPPSTLPGESSPGLQQNIDRSHGGTTGSTTPQSGTRSNHQATSPPDLRDGQAPRQHYVPPAR